jgi:uncharacterized spore protein YtfJ
MEPLEVLQHTQENINARRVFGDPIVADGATVLPVAVVGGGGGGGRKAAWALDSAPGRPASTSSRTGKPGGDPR